MVNIGLRVLSRPDPSSLPKIYRMLGLNWEERILPSICNEVFLLTIFLLFISDTVSIFNYSFVVYHEDKAYFYDL